MTTLLVLTLILSCKSPNNFVETRLKTAEKFISCLKNNEPEKILDFTYHEADFNINNKEFRDFNVNKAFKFIAKFGIPSKDKWIIKYDPSNNFDRLLITIPLFKGYDSTFNLIQADIVLAFPPPEISDQIYRYEIADNYDASRMSPTLAPEDL